jgi:hemoglobin-like flavoprotein
MLPSQKFTDDERVLLRGVFLRLIPQSDEMAKSLYAHLFAKIPEARGMFRGPMEAQRDKLVQMLALMVDALDQPEAFAEACRVSGARHHGYGARPEHYGPLGESLIAALRETCLPPLSAEEEALWVRLYDRVAQLMKEA